MPEQNRNGAGIRNGALGDLRRWHLLVATCPRCRRRGLVEPGKLVWRYPLRTSLTVLEMKLRCTGCGNRQGNTLAVHMARRD